MGLFDWFKKKREPRGEANEQVQKTDASGVITVPISFFDPASGLVGWEKYDQYFEATTRAVLQGIKNITIPRKDYEDALKYIEERKREDRLLGETARLNLEGIELEKAGKIEDAIVLYEENVKLGYPARHSYDRLMILYHKKGDIENEKRIIELAIGQFGGTDKKYQRRLDKLNGQKTESILPESTSPYECKENPLGSRLREIQKSLREFNFYYDLKDGEDTVLYMGAHGIRAIENKRYWDITNELKKLVSDGRELEQDGNIKEACSLYERAVAEESSSTVPYDRLIKIYSKSKLKDDELRVLDKAIGFFTDLRKEQRDYVLYLAKKYGKEQFALDRIENNKKIFYYGGAFELYNPYPIIEDWIIRKRKLVK